VTVSSVSIRATGLCKAYRIAAAAKPSGYRTLQEDLLAIPARLARSLAGADSRATKFWALRDVSFEVHRGEILGVVGGNGAGKSTLLKVLSRITTPTAGYAELFGRVGTLLEVGTGFHPELTGRENVFLSGAVLGMRRAEIAQRFDEIVEFAEVEHFVDTPVKRYSSGMFMRLAFSVAAHLNPEILLVDEVLAVGDADFQRRCVGKLDAVARSGRTVLFVSHNLGTIKALCNRALWLDGGQVREAGNAAAVTQHYLASLSGAREVVKVSDTQHRMGTQEVRITHARVTDAQGTAAGAFLIGEPFQLHLEYTVDAVRECGFWAFVTTADSQVLLSTFQGDTGALPVLTEGGVATAHFEGVQLLPGVYRLCAGLIDRHGHIVDWVDDLATVEVLGHFRDGRAFDGRHGTLTVPLEWSIDREDCIARAV